MSGKVEVISHEHVDNNEKIVTEVCRSRRERGTQMIVGTENTTTCSQLKELAVPLSRNALSQVSS